MLWAYIISDHNGGETELQKKKTKKKKKREKDSRIENVIKKKDNQLYVKCKGYNSSLNSLNNKKRHNINE